jgi:hypothetical protein
MEDVTELLSGAQGRTFVHSLTSERFMGLGTAIGYITLFSILILIQKFCKW